MKKETLEEASKKYTEYLYYKVDDVDEFNGEPIAVHNAFTEGAKWMQEQMHSNKIINILDEITYWDNCPEEYKETISLFTKQFKNK